MYFVCQFFITNDIGLLIYLSSLWGSRNRFFSNISYFDGKMRWDRKGSEIGRIGQYSVLKL